MDGDQVSFTCDVTGGIPTPTIQWSKDGANLNGETANTLSFSASQSSAGDYTCTASNGIGSVTSPAETLVMNGRCAII